MITLKGEKGSKKAHINKELCIGCGVCVPSCNQKAITLKGREKKLITPENFMEKILLSSIEQGKLGNSI